MKIGIIAFVAGLAVLLCLHFLVGGGDTSAPKSRPASSAPSEPADPSFSNFKAN